MSEFVRGLVALLGDHRRWQVVGGLLRHCGGLTLRVWADGDVSVVGPVGISVTAFWPWQRWRLRRAALAMVTAKSREAEGAAGYAAAEAL
jgi:hypothetical protein